MWIAPAAFGARCTLFVPRMAPKRGPRVIAKAAAAMLSEAQQKPSKRSKKSNVASQATAEAAPAAAAETAAANGQATSDSERSYWLMKSEPDVFSIDDLAAKPNQTEHWDGVRSHQAKKVLQSMRVGDHALFYHSNAKPPGVVGVVEIVREAYPDHTQFDSKSEYYDPKATEDKPIWCMVDCRLVRKLARLIPLDELKSHSGPEGGLSGMALFKYGRLSVQPVTAAEWEFVLGLEESGGAEAAGAQGKASSKKRAAVKQAAAGGAEAEEGEEQGAAAPAKSRARGRSGSGGKKRGT